MQTIHSCPTAITAQPTQGTYQVLPTPPAPYAVAYVAEAPALTLASVHAALLPLAIAAGYTSVSVSEDFSELGHWFRGSAHRTGECLLLKSFPFAGTVGDLLKEGRAILANSIADNTGTL